MSVASSKLPFRFNLVIDMTLAIDLSTAQFSRLSEAHNVYPQRSELIWQLGFWTIA